MSKRAQPSEIHMKVAKSVVLEGRSFRSAMTDAGLSQSYADMGPSMVRSRVPSIDAAFKKAEAMLEWRPDRLKQLAVNRIATTCADDRNTDNLKAAELIGKFKTVDLFVRNGEAQVGIFFGALESSDSDIAALELPAKEQDNTPVKD